MSNNQSIEPAQGASSITVNTADRPRCKGVFIGVAGDYDFNFNGTDWIAFTGCVAGSVLPISVVGARHNSGGTAPDAGDIVFLNIK